MDIEKDMDTEKDIFMNIILLAQNNVVVFQKTTDDLYGIKYSFKKGKTQK